MVAQRILNMVPSATSMLGGKIAEMKAAGIDVVGFNLGEPDFPTPDKINEACIKALKAGYTKYTAVSGILPLRKAITEKLAQENGVVYDVNQICVSTGAKQAIFNATLATINIGDEVIIPTPCWVSYVEIVKLAGGVPVLVPTNKDYQLNVEAVKAAVTPRTKAIIINTPNNPTGASYSEKSLLALGELAVKHNLNIISDEVYEKLIYGVKHISLASLSPAIYKQVITVNGFSKTFSMTGWRLGYAAAPVDIAKAMTSLQSHSTTNPTTFVQYAGITALKECADNVENMRQEFAKRRDYMWKRITSIAGITCPKPDGAFYLMPDVSDYFGKRIGDKVINNSFDFCNYILEEALVAIVPGAAFEMPNAVRFAYPVSIETIEKGLARFEKALQKLQ